MRVAIAACVALLTVAHTSLADNPTKDPLALALLKGVESARVKHNNIRAEVVLEYTNRTDKCAVTCLVEQAGQHRRFEQFAGGCLKEGIVILVNDNEFWGYRRKEHEDLEIYSASRSSGVRGDIAFDPRTIGLDEIGTPAIATLRKLLWVENCDQISMLAPEKLNGVQNLHVKAVWNGTVSDFWIEEPVFRVHKRVIQSGDLRIEISSQFDPKDRISPFPKHVTAIRVDGNDWRRGDIIINSFDVDKSIPTERFTMKSIGLPINTMINDYRIGRIIGYWDGEQVSKTPARLSRQNVENTAVEMIETPKSNRAVIIGLNSALLTGLIGIFWWRRRAVSAKSRDTNS